LLLYFIFIHCVVSIMMNAVHGLLTECAAPPFAFVQFAAFSRFNRPSYRRYGISPKDVERLEVGTETVIDKVLPAPPPPAMSNTTRHAEQELRGCAGARANCH
jgi:hypothetical protein